MGIMNKIKGILFDEDEIEVPVDSDELPERTPKEVKHFDRRTTSGFIDHHRDEDIEEDTIKEIIIPKDEPTSEVRITRDTSKFNLVDDEEMDRDFPTDRKSMPKDEYNYDDSHDFNRFDIGMTREERNAESSTSLYKSVDDVRKEYNIAAPVKKHTEEIKDYRKMLNKDDDKTKKPFTVTPIISPVYGILDKNYTAEDISEKRELINKTNSGVKARMFGPVSYNDQPLPTPKKKDTSLKEDLVELNTTITEIINDSILPSDIETPQEIIEEETNIDTEDEIIQTENYDDYETTSIENEYLGNNNIEDAFDSTDEYEKISERENPDSVSDETEPSIDVSAIVNKEEDTQDDDEELDNTIETDLFNLIDSMYKSDDKDSEEE